MRNNRNIAILFFTMVVVMIGFGIIIPIMPFYVESFGASGKALGALMAIFSVMQFLFAPLWGSLSDRYGRKPILLIGVFGNALSLVLMGFSSSLWMLFGSRALAGILSSATLPTAMAYIADSTSERDRGAGMGYIGAAMGVGMVLGPGIGGWLAGRSVEVSQPSPEPQVRSPASLKSPCLRRPRRAHPRHPHRPRAQSVDSKPGSPRHN